MKFRPAIILILLLASCTSKLSKPDAPDDIIPRDTMVLVLRELVILEGYVETKYQNVQNYKDVIRKSGNKVLKERHISPARFDRSYDYYVSRQDELQGIYTEVLDSLNIEIIRLRSDTANSGMEQPAEPGIDVVRPFGSPK